MFLKTLLFSGLAFLPLFTLSVQSAFVSDWATDGTGFTSVKPSAITFNQNIYQVARGEDSRIYTRCICYSGGVATISNWQVDPLSNTALPVSLAVFDGKLFQTAVGRDDLIYTRYSTNGTSWSNWSFDVSGRTKNYVALAAHQGLLYQSVRGLDDKVYIRSSSDGQNWSGWDAGAGQTDQAVALASYNGLLYQSAKGFGGDKIFTRTSVNGVSWSSWERDSTSSTLQPVEFSLANFYDGSGNVTNSVLYQAAVGTDKRVYLRSNIAGTWTSWVKPEDVTSASEPVLTDTPVGLASRRFSPDSFDTLHLVVRGENNMIYWLFIRPS